MGWRQKKKKNSVPVLFFSVTVSSIFSWLAHCSLHPTLLGPWSLLSEGKGGISVTVLLQVCSSVSRLGDFSQTVLPTQNNAALSRSSLILPRITTTGKKKTSPEAACWMISSTFIALLLALSWSLKSLNQFLFACNLQRVFLNFVFCLLYCKQSRFSFIVLPLLINIR